MENQQSAQPDLTAQSFQANADAIAADVLKKFGGEAAAPAAPAPAEAPPAAPPAPAPSPDGITTSPGAPAADPQLAKVLERLAQQDATIRELRSQLTTPAPAPAPEPQRAGIDPQALINDPAGTLAAAGIPPEFIARGLVANALGDKAPVELRAQAAVQGGLAHVLKAMEAQGKQIEALQAEIRRGAFREQVADTLPTLDANKFPAVAAAVRTDPRSARDQILDAVREVSREKVKQGRATEPVTPEEAIARLNEKLTTTARLLGLSIPAGGTQQPAQPAAGSAAAPKPAPVPAASALVGTPAPSTREKTQEEKEQEILADVLKKYGATA